MSPKASDFDRELRAREQRAAPTAKNGASPRVARSSGEYQAPPDPLEQEVIGRFLLGANFTDVAHLVHREDYQQCHGLVLSAVATLAGEGQPHNLPMVQGQLERMGHLTAAGGIGYLLGVQSNTTGPENVETYARAIRLRALRAGLGMESDSDLEKRKRALAEYEALTESAAEKRAGSAGNLQWYSKLSEVEHQEQLVKGLLIAGSLFVIYGDTNSGKTFWTLDLALAVACARPWGGGRRTRRGLVVYVAGEGAKSVRTRVAAYRKARPDIDNSLPFCIYPQAVDFLNPASVDTLIATIRAAEAVCGERAVLVVIDTFARSIPGGNENDARDVGTAVAAADRIRTETGAAVGFVHHAGKDPTKGARGSSALRAATDTEVLIEGQQGPRTVTVTKQRVLIAGERFGFTLCPVDLGVDPDGDQVTSCIVEHVEPVAAARADGATLSDKQRQLLAALRAQPKEGLGIWTLEGIREVGRKAGLHKNTARDAAEALSFSPHLTATVGGWRLTDA